MKKWLSKPATWLVVALIVIWLTFIQKAEAETIVEVAPVTAFGGNYDSAYQSVMAHERFNGKYDVGVIILFDRYGEDGNRAFEVLRTAQYKRWEAGIGYTWWANVQPQAWNTDNTFTLAIGRQWGKWGVRWRHWSTAGTSSRNRGMDMLTIGYRFGK